MAQESGHRLSIGQKLTRWALAKTAGYAQVTLSLTNPKDWKPLIGGSTYSGKNVSDETAMQISAVWACNKILAESVGQLPLAVYEVQKDGDAKKVEHPLAEVLVDSPNAEMDTVNYREAKQLNLGLQGNGYSLIERRGDGNIASLYPVPSSNMVPQRNRDTQEIEYKLLDRGQWEILPREKVWHMRGFGPTGIMGLSPIGCMRQAMGLSMAAEEFGARVFSNGATVSGVVKIPNWLNNDQRVIAQKNLADVYSGLGNAHKLMLLEGGMEFDTGAAMIPPEDLQLLQLRGFQVLEICRLYRIPPHMVADLDRATFANIEQLSLEFVMFALLPWLKRWETSVKRWLMKPTDRKRFEVRFDFAELLRADTQARAEYVRTAVANGLMSRNEGRVLLGLNRGAGGGMDDFTVQSNMVSVDDLAAIAQTMQAQGKAPKWAQPPKLKEAA